MTDVIDNTLSVVSLSLKEGVVLSREIAPSVPMYLFGDSDRLAQILLNLTHNAVKFAEKGSIDLHVTLDREDANRVTQRYGSRYFA